MIIKNSFEITEKDQKKLFRIFLEMGFNLTFEYEKICTELGQKCNPNKEGKQTQRAMVESTFEG